MKITWISWTSQFLPQIHSKTCTHSETTQRITIFNLEKCGMDTYSQWIVSPHQRYSCQCFSLFHPKADAPLNIMTDAFDAAVGGVFQQFVDNTWKPISYFSHKFKPAETHYSTFNRELANYLSIKHFQHFHEGRKFHVITDHKHLLILFSLIPTSTPPIKSDTMISFHSSPQISDISMALTTQ